MSELPRIFVTCRNGHAFQTRARGGQAVNCPGCRAEAERTMTTARKWYPCAKCGLQCKDDGTARDGLRACPKGGAHVVD